MDRGGRNISEGDTYTKKEVLITLKITQLSPKEKFCLQSKFQRHVFLKNPASKIGLAINCICTFWGLKADIKHLLHYYLATKTATLWCWTLY